MTKKELEQKVEELESKLQDCQQVLKSLETEKDEILEQSAKFESLYNDAESELNDTIDERDNYHDNLDEAMELVGYYRIDEWGDIPYVRGNQRDNLYSKIVSYGIRRGYVKIPENEMKSIIIKNNLNKQ